jgi:hypothetical protein
MYNQQENYNGWKDPNAEEKPQHDPNKWMWIEDDIPSAIVDMFVSELSVENDLKLQQL